MDHFYLPSRSYLQPFEFPLLCQPTYKRGNWQSYPEQEGYKVTGEISGDFEISKTIDGELQDISEDDELVAAFFQQWLWFGILLEMLEDVDVTEFIKTTPDGKQYLNTTTLQQHSQQWVASALDQPWASTWETVQEWAAYRWRMIRRTRTIVGRYLQTYDCLPKDIVSITVLSIALICEHFHKVLYQIYSITTVDDPWIAIPKFNWREQDFDCAMAIVEVFKEGGWCPNTLAGMGMYTCRMETLWFYANLEAPKGNLGHENCSAEECVYLQIDHDTYRTKHTKDDCNCHLMGPDPLELADVVTKEKLPLTRVVFEADGAIKKIEVWPREADTKFVAISHVWADGRGNPDANLLPSCFLQELQASVDKIAGETSVLFWMDTLSIPREPRSVRKLALKKLRDPYDYAEHVLVLDAYLQSQNGRGRSVIELLALVNVSSWAQRLWTFQEGRLAKDIWFEFMDGNVCMSHSDGIQEALRSDFISEVPLDIVLLHSSTKSTTEFWTVDASTSISALREGIRLRSTSVATDEALCLGSIAGFDMGKILDLSESERMAEFWRMVSQIPAGLGLSKASRKMEQKGLRWAPASLMGDIENHEWAGPPLMFGQFAELSSDGLVCQLAYLKFPSKPPPLLAKSLTSLYDLATNEDHVAHDFVYDIKLRTYEGKWIQCVFEEAWHQTPINIPDDEIPAILLESPIYLLDDSKPTETLAGENISALLVSYKPSADGTNMQAHAIRHCSLYFASHTHCAFLEELDTISHQFMNDYWDDVLEAYDEWEKIHALVELRVPQYVLNGPCLEIGRVAIGLLRGTSDVDDEAVIQNATVIVASLCFVGPYVHVDDVMDPVGWVID